MAPSTALQVYTKRLKRVRQVLVEKQIDALWIPMADPFHNEYVLASYQYIKWLSGFRGSAGQLVITQTYAVLITDGRYTAEAPHQVNTHDFEILETGPLTLVHWLQEHLGPHATLGFDPWLHSPGEIDILTPKLKDISLNLMPLSLDFLKESLAADLPQDHLSPPTFIYPEKYAGKSFQEKCLQISSILQDQRLDYFFLHHADSICWLLNIRGNDVPHTPVVVSYVLIKADGTVDWFVDSHKITPEIHAALSPTIRFHSPATLKNFLKSLKGKRVGLNHQTTPYQISLWLQESNRVVVFSPDPCALPKACKNTTEIERMRDTHLRDGVALTKFLYWLHQQDPLTLTELKAAATLDDFRRHDPHWWNLSFSTIAAVDGNSALPHYHPTPETDKPFQQNSIFLVDSGGQYKDGGTTDVTRTVLMAGGAPKPLHDLTIKDKYTRVLKGHMALFLTSFPVGTTGAQLDGLARQYLWEVGVDFNHSTGHGIGCFLNVHESPPNISRRSHAPLQVGMIVTNEPGYYEKGNFGIRLENVMVVVPCPKYHGMLSFENLTWAPYDFNLIDWALMTPSEKNWLRGYHEKLLDKMAPYISTSMEEWIKSMVYLIP